MSASAKYIVWDWNGTLLDDTDAVVSAYNFILASVGHGPITVASYQDWHEMPFENILRRAGLSESELEKVIAAEWNHMFHDHYEPLADHTPMRDGALEILGSAHAHNVHSYILSNHLETPIRRQLDRLNLEHFFKEVLAYANRETQFKHMTKGERLKRYVAENSLGGGNSVIVGDTIEEIEIARDQALLSVAITGGCVSESRLRAAKPDHLIHSLHELKPILQEGGFVS